METEFSKNARESLKLFHFFGSFSFEQRIFYVNWETILVGPI